MEDAFSTEREDMVREQIVARGVRDERVLAAMRKVPRHLFVPEALIAEAYEDHPLPIGQEQTISQPYIVALMLEHMRLTGVERVLEIGTGSGYQTALLAELCRTVYTVERLPALADAARERVHALGGRNVRYRVGDGTLGWPEEAPFNVITVGAAAPAAPQPLLDQLAEGGRLLIPVGDRSMQTLTVCERRNGRIESRFVTDCRFVKLIGREGWQD